MKHARLTLANLRNLFRMLRLFLFSPRFFLVKAQRKTLYWKLLESGRNLLFHFQRKVFALRGWARERGEGLGIWGQVLWAVWKEAAFAAALVVGMLAADRLALQKLGETTWALKAFTSDQGNLLSTVAQIGGVFLGLYFTAVSVVISTSYARVPRRIRDLLMREKVGNRYIRIVALLAVVCLLLLAASIVGFQPGLVSGGLVTTLSVIAVYSFVVLGLRVFYFFDPTSLSALALRDVQQAMKAAGAPDFGATEAPFQDYYQRQAAQGLAAIRELVVLCNEEKYLQGEPLQVIAAELFSTLRKYVHVKKQIPTASRWFQLVPRHRQWLLERYEQIDIALRTGTTLQPEYVPEPFWIEIEVADIVGQLLDGMERREDRDGVLSVLRHAQGSLETIGQALAVDEAALVFDRLTATAKRLVAKTPIERIDAAQRVSRNITYTLAILDLYGLCPIGVLVSLVRALESLTPTVLRNKLDSVNWRRRHSLYQQQLPQKLLSQIEELQRGIDFELAVEGLQITERWYVQQLVTLALLRVIKDGLEKLEQEIERTFVQYASELSKEKTTVVYSAQHIQRGLEFCSKFLVHLPRVRKRFEALEEHRKAQDIPWPVVEWTRLEESAIKSREALVTTLAQCVVPIASLGRTEKLPDYFGHAYSILAEECYSALAQQKTDFFRMICGPFFAAALLAYEQLRERLRDQRPETFVVFSSEPLADLLEISGYAKIYSEFHGDNSAWHLVELTWNKYLDAAGSPEQLLQHLVGLTSLRESIFGLKPRDIARTGWSMELHSRLKEAGLARDLLDHDFGEGRAEMRRHSSPIIRAIGRRVMIGLDEAANVFLATYARKRPEARSVKEWPSGILRFEETLERETVEGAPSQ